MSQPELTYQTCDLDHKTKITPLKKIYETQFHQIQY